MNRSFWRLTKLRKAPEGTWVKDPGTCRALQNRKETHTLFNVTLVDVPSVSIHAQLPQMESLHEPVDQQTMEDVSLKRVVRRGA